MSDHLKELASKEIKLLEENQVAQHRFSNLKARLVSLQNDQDPRTPITKLQEQVNLISSVNSRAATGYITQPFNIVQLS